MMKSIKRLSITTAAGLLVASVTGAFAQEPANPHHPQGAPADGAAAPPWHMMQGGPALGMMGGNCPTMGAIMHGEDVPSYSEGRLAFLKTELAITDAQESLWGAYAGALRSNFESMHEMRRAMKTRMSDMTPVQRLDAHLTAMRGRLTALEDVKPPLTALYAALSADQRKKADQLLTEMGCMM